jgi:hypothetical protein
MKDALNLNDELWPDLAARIVDLPATPAGQVVAMVGKAMIDEVVRFPSFLFSIQPYNDLKNFFGRDFLMPRTIPFGEREKVHVVLSGDSLLIGNRRGSISFPLFFLHIKVVAKQRRVIVSSPVGSFKLGFVKESEIVRFRMMKMVMAYQEITKDRYEDGELQRQTNKANVFHCLTAFVPSESRNVTLRFMIVRAGRKEECRDLCYARVMESVALPPVYFNLMVKSLGESSGNIIRV